MNSAVVLLGSNIEPAENIQYALGLLNQTVNVEKFSRIYKTPSHGSPGPDFLNLAVKFSTRLSLFELKQRVHSIIEITLGRKRVADKNAPRTMDIDTIIYNTQVVDDDLWNKIFVALPVSDIYPDLVHPKTKYTLKQISEKLKSSKCIELYHPPAGFFPN